MFSKQYYQQEEDDEKPTWSDDEELGLNSKYFEKGLLWFLVDIYQMSYLVEQETNKILLLLITHAQYITKI